MSKQDYSRIAQQIHDSITHKLHFSLPIMKVADLGEVLKCLKCMRTS